MDLSRSALYHMALGLDVPILPVMKTIDRALRVQRGNALDLTVWKSDYHALHCFIHFYLAAKATGIALWSDSEI